MYPNHGNTFQRFPITLNTRSVLKIPGIRVFPRTRGIPRSPKSEIFQGIQEFRKIPELYPTGNKVPDALLKIGFAYAALGEKKAARRTLRQVMNAYPQSEATQRARDRLAEMENSTKH